MKLDVVPLDRGSMSNTIIGKAYLITNSIAHNEIVENSIITGQVGIAGSMMVMVK